MAGIPPKVILCSCEDTMTLDTSSVRKGLPDAAVSTARHLCGPEIARFKAAADSGEVIVCCTQEAARFREVAEDAGLPAALRFVNVRETAGWSAEGRAAGPKMAALIAEAAVETPVPAGVTLESEGITLIYGRGPEALAAAELLQDRLDITLLLTGDPDVVPPRTATFPIRKGRISTASGHLGAFDLAIDALATPLPSSRARLRFGPPRDGARSKADIVIDLSGGLPLFPGDGLRDGYLRADPGDPAAVQRVLFKAAELVGTFDKPRYIDFHADLCAHSRSRIVGCRRCLDLCPAGAISPAGDTVAIDPQICGGCGACAAACPTGAASYAVPSADVLLRRLRALLAAYREAGGTDPVVLFHDGDFHGAALIDALARFADGLPARVLPVALNETGQLGLEAVAAAFAYGASAVQVLTRAKPKHDIAGLRDTLATADVLLAALGYGHDRARTIETDDPDALAAALASVLASGTNEPPAGASPRSTSSFLPLGGKRDVLKLALRELHRVAPTPVATVPLPKGAVFGRVAVNTDGCTLCLSCVSSCPTGALSDDQERPTLRFDESLCVQCGLCRGTCPERVISLEPRIDFAAFAAGPLVLKQEEPFCCTKCGKAFGVKSTIERVKAKLTGAHWMFKGDGSEARLALIEMCDDCRIETATNASIDPYGAPQRAPPRTTDDYFREREEREARERAMLDKIDRGEV